MADNTHCAECGLAFTPQQKWRLWVGDKQVHPACFLAYGGVPKEKVTPSTIEAAREAAQRMLGPKLPGLIDTHLVANTLLAITAPLNDHQRGRGEVME